MVAIKDREVGGRGRGVEVVARLIIMNNMHRYNHDRGQGQGWTRGGKDGGGKEGTRTGGKHTGRCQ